MAIRYVRYRDAAGVRYGIMQGGTVQPLGAAPWEGGTPEASAQPLADVTLVCPCRPGKILAVGRNYKSHLHGRPQPSQPEMFYKPVSSVQDPEQPILVPPDATNVHFEGEMVVVVGRRVRHASVEEARAAIFGVTCGNDVSEREWQSGSQKDLQWWRAKGSDTFAPLGPAIAAGLDYGNLRLTTRLNGEEVQAESTADLIFDCPTIVSFISRWVTLEPGDVIYTGTPGSTRKMNPGDVVEVEIEEVGTLRNPVAA